MIAHAVIDLLLISVGTLLTASVAYLAVFSAAGALRSPRRDSLSETADVRFAVLIPAYREDAVIAHTARAVLTQDYPSRLFDVVVIADGLRRSTLEELEKLPIRVVEIQPRRSTKAVAINEALRRLRSSDYDMAVVLDADNVMNPDVLKRFASAYESGARAIQGHRVAKNLDTPFACLDAVSEEVNNHIFRRGHVSIGLSSALIGSGMAFDFGLFADIMKDIEEFSEDKEIELALLQRRTPTRYLEEAIIYDEKVGSGAVFTSQRGRWIEGQRRYRRLALSAGWKAVRVGGIDYANKLVQLALPPRGALILLVPLLGLVALIAGRPGIAVWSLLLTLVLAMAIAIAVPWRRLGGSVVSALRVLPQAVGRLMLAFVVSRDRSRNALATPHSQATVEDGTVRSTYQGDC